MPKASSMPPPPKSPTRLSGGTGFVLAADRMQRAGQRDVVDVVAGGLGERAFLAPAGHASIDELGIAGEADIGAEAQPLGDAGPEGLGHAIGLLDQTQNDLDAFLALQVD